jgi:hypothetical protein
VLHPVGPLPASVYWRRRAVVVVGVVAGLVLLGSTLGGGDGTRAGGALVAGGQDGSPAAGTSTGAPTGSAAAEPTPSGSLGGTPPLRAQHGAGDPAPVDGDPGAETTVTQTPAASPDPPGPCRDSALRLTVRPMAAVYSVGDMPVIALAVQNVSAATCTRDLGAAAQEVLLYAGTTRLWSSNDCYPGGLQDVQALLPRERATFSVRWSGLSSKPRCAGSRTRVGPGRYRLLGRLGTLRSAAATLTLR